MENETKIYIKNLLEETKSRVNENGNEADVKMFEIIMKQYLIYSIHDDVLEKISNIINDKVEFKEEITKHVFNDMENEEKISALEIFFGEQRMLKSATIESLLKHERELLRKTGEKDV